MLTRTTRPQRRPGRDGRSATAAVELAMLLPLLFALVIGLIEVSRGIMVKEALDDAARRACRHGAQYGTTNTDLTTDITNTLDNANLPSANATVTIQVNGATANVSTASRYDKISVQVSIPASKVYWTLNVFGSSYSIKSETVSMMRQQ